MEARSMLTDSLCRNCVRLMCGAIGLVLYCLPVHSQVAPVQQCPVGYWRHESVCIHRVTGDVVNAAARTASEADCTPAYWRLGEICIDLETGNVEMAREERTHATSR